MFSEDIIIKKIDDVVYQCNIFTLTVNAVNDAPILLQPFKDLEILDDSEAAAVVCHTVF